MIDSSTLETAYDALASDHRRHLLVALERADDRLRVPQDVPEMNDVTERLEVRLHHLHLPKLEAGGFIDWDRKSNEISPGKRFDAVRPVLTTMVHHDDGQFIG